MSTPDRRGSFQAAVEAELERGRTLSQLNRPRSSSNYANAQTQTDAGTGTGNETLNRDTIAGIIADLIHNERNSLSRPPSSHQSSHHNRNTSAYSFEPLCQDDIERMRRSSYGSAIDTPRTLRPDDDFEDVELYDMHADGRRRYDPSHDFVSDVVDNYAPSKHTSLSGTVSTRKSTSGLMMDSAISLKGHRFSRRSTLSQGPSPLQETASIQDIPDELPPRPSEGSRGPGGPGGPDGPPGGPPGPSSYPGPAKTILIMVSLYISIFLVALDRTIIGPAIPAITNQFKSLDDVGWYGSAYMLTSCGFILLYGRIYTFFPTKATFLSGIGLFEAGSAVCGAASSSLILIIGRAIQGLGSSGIFTGAILIMLNTVPLHKRPMLQGLFGACFGVASVTGPLLGGAFTGSSLTWRWCFYINLPLGGVTVAVVLFFLRLEESKPKLPTWWDTFKQMDPIGLLLFMPSIVCLILALEWGASEPWSSARIIGLLTAFSALFVAFGVWQYYTRNTTATVPARILFQRSVAFGGLSQFCVGSTMLSVSMYLPLWFQAIKNVSAMQSGIDMIPLVLSVVVGSITSGGATQKLGYYTPFMIAGSCLMAVGTGLITAWNMNTSNGLRIGSQIILGLGVGNTMQHPNLAVQVVLPKQDVPTGTALLSLCQTLGGAVFVAVGQNLFIDKFSEGILQIPGLKPENIVNAGATDIRNHVPERLLPRVLGAYNNALTQGPFFAALIVACIALPAAIGMEWRSVKQQGQGPPQQRPSADDEEKANPQAENETRRNSLEMRANESEAMETRPLSPLEPPMPAWRKIYRSSGQFSQWMTARVNPDLRGELGPRR